VRPFPARESSRTRREVHFYEGSSKRVFGVRVQIFGFAVSSVFLQRRKGWMTRCEGADADSFRRRANWHLCPFRCVGRTATRACPHAPFSHRQSPRTSRVLQVTSAAHRIASGSPSFPLPARAPPRVMANVRHVPTVPFAASAMEGAVRKRATLSDTENLAVGAFGGVLETCIQSTSQSRSRARVRVDSPPHRPSRTHPFFCHLERGGCPRRRPRRRPRAASERSARKRVTHARAPPV